MTAAITLELDHDGVRLTRREGGGETELGWVPLDDPDFAERLAAARDAAGDDAPLPAEVVLPRSLVFFLEAATGDDAVEARIARATSCRVDDLVIGRSGRVAAAVERATIEEAADFARAHGFDPTAYVALPDNGSVVSFQLDPPAVPAFRSHRADPTAATPVAPVASEVPPITFVRSARSGPPAEGLDRLADALTWQSRRPDRPAASEPAPDTSRDAPPEGDTPEIVSKAPPPPGPSRPTPAFPPAQPPIAAAMLPPADRSDKSRAVPPPAASADASTMPRFAGRVLSPDAAPAPADAADATSWPAFASRVHSLDAAPPPPAADAAITPRFAGRVPQPAPTPVEPAGSAAMPPSARLSGLADAASSAGVAAAPHSPDEPAAGGALRPSSRSAPRRCRSRDPPASGGALPSRPAPPRRRFARRPSPSRGAMPMR